MTSTSPTHPGSRATRPLRVAFLHATTAGLVLALTAALIPVAPRLVIAAETPDQVVEQTTSSVIAVLSQQDLPSEEKRRRIQDIVYARMDFETLSRLVLARNWSRFSEPQQREFIEEFKRHLALTYGNRVDSYRNERVVVTGSRQESQGDWTVKTKVVRGSGDQDLLLDYRLRQRDGSWRIIDVIVEGVSLVANFRSQFQDVMASGGPQRVLDVLHEKNSKGEPLRS